MTIVLTPEMLETCYEWLRTTPPFRAWNLPHADHVEFRVLAARDRAGHFGGSLDPAVPDEIGISMNGIKSYYDLYEVMAHEMVHFYLHRIDKADEDDHHGPQFVKAAKRVCKAHGFHPITFCAGD